LNISLQFPIAAARGSEQLQPLNLPLREITSTAILYCRFTIGHPHSHPQMTLQMPCQFETHLANPQHLHPELFLCRSSTSHKAIFRVLKTLWQHVFPKSNTVVPQGISVGTFIIPIKNSA
jgi:hypothetical protein